MSKYTCATICMNGHTVCDYQTVDDNYCGKCGAKAIANCLDCGEPIRGREVLEDADICALYRPPKYCHKCGKPFPWTERAIQAISLIIEEDESIDNTAKDKVYSSLPDVMFETPASSLAANRLKKVLTSAGKFTADAIRQFIIDFGCEYVKKTLGF